MWALFDVNWQSLKPQKHNETIFLQLELPAPALHENKTQNSSATAQVLCYKSDQKRYHVMETTHAPIIEIYISAFSRHFTTYLALYLHMQGSITYPLFQLHKVLRLGLTKHWGIILAKGQLATTNHDSAPMPQRSRFSKPTVHCTTVHCTVLSILEARLDYSHHHSRS